MYQRINAKPDSRLELVLSLHADFATPQVVSQWEAWLLVVTVTLIIVSKIENIGFYPSLKVVTIFQIIGLDMVPSFRKSRAPNNYYERRAVWTRTILTLLSWTDHARIVFRFSTGLLFLFLLLYWLLSLNRFIYVIEMRNLLSPYASTILINLSKLQNCHHF